MIHKKRGPKFKSRRPFSRADVLPKKVIKEEMAWDIAFHRMRRSIEAAFPNLDERLQYIVSLIEGLEE